MQVVAIDNWGPWEIFKDGIFWAINWFYDVCGDWGLAIVFITIVFRLLVFPITRKQFKSSYQMQKMQPKINEIKEKYKDDQQRQQQETMKVYQEAKFNPLAGCLPMLLQMPIFIALYQTLGALSENIYRAQNDLLFQPLKPESLDTSFTATFYGLIPDLSLTPGMVFSDQGLIAAIPYVIMLILFAGSLLIPMLLQQSSDRNTRVMMIVMSVFMLWVGWNAPAGVLLYWDVSSYIGVGQQIVSRKLLEKKDKEQAEEIEVVPVKVDVERSERKARPKKKK